MPDTTASLILEVDSKGVVLASHRVEDLTKASGKAAKSSKVLAAATKLAVGALVAASVVIVKTTKQWLDYDKAMKEVESISGLTTKQFKSVRKEMLGVSQDLGIATDDMASASFQAVSAGVAAKNLGQFMHDAGQLAIGGVSSITVSVDILTTAINAYGLSVSEASEVSDKLITGSKLGKTNLTEVAASFANAAPLAATLGVSIDELLTSMVVMTKQGISTSESFTKINALMTALIKPSDQLKDSLKGIGQASGVASIEALGLQGTVEALSDSVEGDAVKMAKLFPRIEGLTGALALMTQEGELAKETLDEMKDSAGAVAKAADINSKSLPIQINKLKASLVGVAESSDFIQDGLAGTILLLDDLAKGVVLSNITANMMMSSRSGEKKVLDAILERQEALNNARRKEKTIVTDNTRLAEHLAKVTDAQGVSISKVAQALSNMGNTIEDYDSAIEGLNESERILVESARLINHETMVMSRSFDDSASALESILAKARELLGIQEDTNTKEREQKEHIDAIAAAAEVMKSFQDDILILRESQLKILTSQLLLDGDITDEQRTRIALIKEEIKERTRSREVQEDIATGKLFPIDSPLNDTSPAPSKRVGKSSAESQLEAIRQSLLTEEEAIRESHATRIAFINETSLLSTQDRHQLLRDLENDHLIEIDQLHRDSAARQAQDKENAMRSQLGAATQFFDGITQLAETQGKKGAKIAQAAALTQATIKTYEGANSAYASAASIPGIGHILAPIAAAGAIASGLYNVSSIRSAGNFAHGGVVGGSSFSGDNLQANVNSGEMILNRTQQANLFNAANGRGGGGAKVVINNFGSAEIEQRTNSQGEIEITIDRKLQEFRGQLNTDIALGGNDFSDSFEQNFSLSRA